MKSPEKQFLHDISNLIAICYGNIKIVSTKLAKNPEAVTQDYLSGRLLKSLDAFDKLNALIAERRDLIIQEQEASENQAS